MTVISRHVSAAGKSILSLSACLFLGYSAMERAAAGPVPTCNAQTTVTNNNPCGTPRACVPAAGDCAGSSVVQSPSTTSCGKGSPNEYCAPAQQTCTRTLYCADNGAGSCVGDSGDPVIDSNGNPIVSTTVQAALQTCQLR